MRLWGRSVYARRRVLRSRPSDLQRRPWEKTAGASHHRTIRAFPASFFSFFSLLVFLDSFSTRLPHGPAPKGRKEEVLASRWISKTGHWYPRRASSSWPILPRASPLFLTLIRFAGGFPTAASAGFFRFLPDLIPFPQVSVGFTWWDLQDYIFFSRTFSYIFYQYEQSVVVARFDCVPLHRSSSFTKSMILMGRDADGDWSSPIDLHHHLVVMKY